VQDFTSHNIQKLDFEGGDEIEIWEGFTTSYILLSVVDVILRVCLLLHNKK
jgi:hypothetical protein